MSNPKFKDFCACCKKSLSGLHQIYFIEIEVGRAFCTPECISDYFKPQIEQFSEDFQKLHSDSDIPYEDFRHFNKYREETIQDPDEIWMQTLESGDHLYHYISEYEEAGKKFHYVVCTYCLNGQPSFILMSFPTMDIELITFYRNGEELLEKGGLDLKLDPEYEQILDRLTPKLKDSENNNIQKVHSNFKDANLEVLMKYLRDHRQTDDIPESDFHLFEAYSEKTIEDPDEIWVISSDLMKSPHPSGIELCIFISHYFDDDGDQFSVITVTKPDTQNMPSLQVVLSFPTIDPVLVQMFRKGLNTLNRSLGLGSQLVA